MALIAPDRQAEILSALGELLAAAGQRCELVVIGGSALVALGLVRRVTRDVDVVGVIRDGDIVGADPLPPALAAACLRVARDFDLPEDWLNAGPSDLLDFGLPSGFTARMEARDYGPALRVFFASRLDQVHLKLYAMVDQGAGRHEADLRALAPTRGELLRAARWTRSHDPSPGFREMLVAALAHLGIDDADADL